MWTFRSAIDAISRCLVDMNARLFPLRLTNYVVGNFAQAERIQNVLFIEPMRFFPD
jgi:hypothetical protein